MPFGAVIAGGLGAGGSLISGLLQSNAAQQASQALVGFGQQALGTQQGMFSNALQQIQGLFGQGAGAISPVINTGQSEIAAALPTLTKLLTPGANMTQTLSQIPGFRFAQDWGQTGVANQASATGLGGNQIAAGANYATGLAQQGYGSIVNALQNLVTSGGNLAGQGASAFGSLAGNVGSTIGNVTGNAMNTIGQTTQNIGTSTAQGILGSASALGNAATGGASSIGNAFLLSQLTSKLNNQNQGSGTNYSTGIGAYSGDNWAIG